VVLHALGTALVQAGSGAVGSSLFSPQAGSSGGFVDAFRNFASNLVDRLPNLLLGLIFLVLAVVTARLVRRGVEAALRRTSTEAYVHLLVAKLAYFGVLLVGLVVALSLAGVNVAVLVGSLGLATVALGFALQDILSNFVAGIVLLLEHPFTKGDMIVTTDVQGSVEDIRVRATVLRTPDGQQVLVPNKLLFTSVLVNQSATVARRLEVRVSLPYGQDSGHVRELLLAAVGGVDGALDERPPRVLTDDLGQGALQLRVWFWVDPRATDLLRARSEALEAAEEALTKAGVQIAVPQLTANIDAPIGGTRESPENRGEDRGVVT
jgi:small conductance mechanosensitive channel